jgi:hypothetical protein
MGLDGLDGMMVSRPRPWCRLCQLQLQSTVPTRHREAIPIYIIYISLHV